MSEPIVVIAGPTASGKSALALRLARELDGEVVNADSQQVYRGLDVGTGKPSAEERALVPHHLFDVAEAWQQLDAAKFVQLADRAIADVQSRGRVALVVGGTGLWLRALLHGLVDAPPRDEALREALRREADEHGLASLHERLRTIDPDSAEKVSPNDPVRIIRALEIHALTGTTQSELHRRHANELPRYDAVRIALDLPTAELESRIRRRVIAMFESGLVAETRRALIDERAFERLSRVMGYREALEVIHGKRTVEAAIELVVIAQRQYAKRQRTWFRAEPEWRWVGPDDAFDVTVAEWRARMSGR